MPSLLQGFRTLRLQVLQVFQAKQGAPRPPLLANLSVKLASDFHLHLFRWQLFHLMSGGFPSLLPTPLLPTGVELF